MFASLAIHVSFIFGCLAISIASMWAEWLRSAERYDASICSWVSVAGLCLCHLKNVFAFTGAFTSASVRAVRLLEEVCL
jgi:hypothetical protein